METQSWDRVYKEQGQVQINVLPKVITAADKFKKKRYGTLLDLACGTGRHAIYLAKEGFDVYASDISENGLEIAKRNEVLAGVHINFYRGDMSVIPYSDEFFDAVICVWSINIGTFSNISGRVTEIHRVLKNGGTLITDFISVSDETYGKGRQIENNTFQGAMQGLPDLIEHYSTKSELIGLFSKFRQSTINESDHFYFDQTGNKHVIRALDVEAIK